MTLALGLRLALAGTAALALAACAAAGPPAPTATTAPAGNGAAAGHEKEVFVETYDTDGDGVVTRAEFDAERVKGFAERDADKDGVVHKEEYVAEYEARLDADLAARRAAQMKQADSRFDVLDDDKDGALTKAEFDDSGAFVFGALDTDGDGVVDDEDTAKAY